MAQPDAPERPANAPIALVDGGPRMAGWVFAALVMVAGPFYAIAGRSQWFFQDEWTLLARRDGGSLDSLLAAHNGEHWVTLPVVVYRVLWNIFGITTYKPYQAVAIGLHLVVAILLRAVIRRAGVRPWVATVVASVFLFYGRGAENVVWAFQISFTGAIALGLGHLLLADHDDPSARRTFLGLLCGVGALMCSGVGVIMAVIVGLFLLLRRGWIPAAIHTVPLGVVYLLWWRQYPGGVDRPVTSLSDKVDYVRIGLGTAMTRLQDHRLLTVALGVAAVVGLTILVRDRRRSTPDLRRALALPVSLVSATLGFFVLGAFSRAGTFSPDYASRSRFSYVAVALLVPVAAVAFDALIERRTWTALPVLAILVAGVPGNLAAVEVRSDAASSPPVVLSVANQPLPATVPDTFTPFQYAGIRAVTLGWLRDGVRSDRIPGIGEIPQAARRRVAGALSVLVMPARPGNGTCRAIEGTEVIHLDPGGAINFRGALMVRPETPDPQQPPEVSIGSFEIQSLTAIGAPVTLHVRATPGAYPGLCDTDQP